MITITDIGANSRGPSHSVQRVYSTRVSMSRLRR